MESNQPSPEPNEELPIIGDQLQRRGSKFSRAVTRSLLNLFGWRIVGEVPNVSKILLVGAPHTSNWDFILTIATMFSLGVHFSWVAKHTLFVWPFAGIFYWLGGVRLNRTTTEGFVDQMVDEFQEREKFFLAIMPEGTRSKVREWRTGFYYIAHRAQVPMMAVIFDYGKKRLRVGPTFYASGDITADLPYIQSIYKDAKGRNPF